MRVLLISHTCQSRTEGQPRAEHLARIEGIDLKVLVPDRWRHYGAWRAADVPARSPLYEVGRVALPWVGPAQNYLHFYPRLGRLLRAFRPDVIDLWEEPWALVSAHACRLRNKLLPGAKIVSETEQNIDKALPPPFERFRSYTLANADFVVGRSAEAVEVVRRKGYAGPSAVVPNAVDAELFRPMDRAACRRELGWPADGFVAGYVGRLVEEKGVTDLVDALSRCPADICAAFVGDGPMRGELQRRAAAAGVSARVRLLPARPMAELPTVMNALDVLVLPSRTTARWKEQFGRVIIEAHACGVPVIGSSSGAIPEVVGAGGSVFDEGDVAALADRLVDSCNSAERGRSAGAAGLERVNASYTWASVAGQMAELFRSCTAGTRPEGAS